MSLAVLRSEGLLERPRQEDYDFDISLGHIACTTSVTETDLPAGTYFYSVEAAGTWASVGSSGLSIEPAETKVGLEGLKG